MLEHVPSSRADVFKTKHVSVVEKRILMKFLTFCSNYQDHENVYEAYQEKSFYDFLKSQKSFVFNNVYIFGLRNLTKFNYIHKFIVSV